jgi:hypothetical protein
MNINKKILTELTYLGIFFFLAIIIFKIAFYSEPILNVLKLIFNMAYSFVLPGYFVLLYYHEKLDFLQRTILGTFVMFAIYSSWGYNIGIIGIKIKVFAIFTPIILIFWSVLLNNKIILEKKSSEN